MAFKVSTSANEELKRQRERESDELKNELTKALTQKFELVEVSRSNLDTAEKKLQGQLMDFWDEKMVHDVTRGVPKDSLVEYTECMSESLGLDDEQKTALLARMKVMKFAKANDSNVLEMQFNIDEFKSMYGYVSMIQEPDKTIAIAYAVHKLNFKMAAKEQHYIRESDSSAYKRNQIVDVFTRTERVKFSEGDINAVKETYGRFKALDTLKKEGVINAIKFVD